MLPLHQEQETLQKDFNAICDSIVNSNIVPSQHSTINSPQNIKISDFDEYAMAVINKMKTSNPWGLKVKIDLPGYITTEQLTKMIELRHKNAEQIQFYKRSTKIITVGSIIIWTLFCICFGLISINVL